MSRSGAAFLRLVFGLLALAVVAVAAGAPAPAGSYTAVMAAATALCALRAVRVAEERLAWGLMALALLLWTAGDLAWDVDLGLRDEPPFPSYADVLYLAYYPASYAAMILLLRARLRSVRSGLWLDGVIGGLTVAAVGAAVVFQPVLDATSGDPATVAVSLAYPLLDLLQVLFVVAVCGALGWRPGRSWALVGAGLLLSAVADAIFAWQEAVGTYAMGEVLDALWPAAGVLVALAAWSRGERLGRRRRDGWAMILLPAGFAVVALAVLGLAHVALVSDLAVVLALAALALTLVRAGLTVAENIRLIEASRREALTDGLTGLPNRRMLMGDLDQAYADPAPRTERTLAFFDLNGFKRYNDSFGHAAGDALLARLAQRLQAVVGDRGRAYRLGGDEFCAVVHGALQRNDPAVLELAESLVERGEGFEVTASVGVIRLFQEAASPAAALQLADGRMYAEKNGGLASGRHQAYDVLLQVLDEREPELRAHMREVGGLARRVAARLGLRGEAIDEVVRGAELHDIGKMAMPDAILHKPGPLDDGEWAFVRQHTIIGERILAAAPALRPVARLVRASHERWDGGGYPDRLSGETIPLGARIIAVCDSFDAMRSDRAYRPGCSEEEALAELRRCAGSQFDAVVVDAVCAELAAAPHSPRSLQA